jgi:hypothetical protein
MAQSAGLERASSCNTYYHAQRAHRKHRAECRGRDERRHRGSE